MNQWAGKHVAVVGLGVSNLPLIRYLCKHGAVVSGRDRKSAEQLGERYNALEQLGVECQLGEDYLEDLHLYDAVFLTPGIPKHLPEITSLIGKVPILSEVALVLQLAKAPVYGITGSSGKTTTTTLVGEMLRASGIHCHVGGNIGVPLIEQVEDIPPDQPIVMELSSFQLELLNQSPHGALITNISENHLDVHLTMDNYIRAKKQIYLHQKPSDVAVFNYDDPITRAMAAEAKSQVFFFSSQFEVPQGMYVDGSGDLIYRDHDGQVPVLNKQDIRLMGEHNVLNIMAAALLAHNAGANWESIVRVAREFKGVAHRLEHIATIRGVDYYNDSIATSPTRTIAGIKAFNQPIILIAGGYDKKLSFDELAALIGERVKAVVLFGQTAAQIQQAIELKCPDYHQIYRVLDLPAAVQLAAKLAEPNDVVLLSPACASYDQYPNFEVRGDHFRQIVHNLLEGLGTHEMEV